MISTMVAYTDTLVGHTMLDQDPRHVRDSERRLRMEKSDVDKVLDIARERRMLELEAKANVFLCSECAAEWPVDPLEPELEKCLFCFSPESHVAPEATYTWIIYKMSDVQRRDIITDSTAPAAETYLPMKLTKKSYGETPERRRREAQRLDKKLGRA